jgi:hypothetical protein
MWGLKKKTQKLFDYSNKFFFMVEKK